MLRQMNNEKWLALLRVNKILAGLVKYESGTLSGKESVELFQELIDCGLAFSLDKGWHEMAQELVSLGRCRGPKWPEW
jgi:hypothetical protein